METNKEGRDIAALATDYADGVSARWRLDARAADAVRDLVLDAVAAWTVEEISDAGDRCAEAADTAAPIYYTEQAALLADELSLSMVRAGVDDIGAPKFDHLEDDFYQWTCATAAAGWYLTLATAMEAAVAGLVEVPGLVALGLSEDAAEVAARLAADGWTGNLAGLHLAAELLGGPGMTE